jgi:hypothetical protein
MTVTTSTVVRRIISAGAVAILVATGSGATAATDDLAPQRSAVVIDRGVRITESVSSDSLSYDGPAVTATLTLVTGTTSQTVAVGVESSA